MFQFLFWIYLLVVGTLITSGDAAPESNSWITPIPNLDAAMEGFDPVRANPFERPDPGSRNQIFESMNELPDGRVVLNSFIDKAREDIHCDVDLSSQTLSNYNAYNEEKSSSYRFSMKVDSSVSVGFWGFGFRASVGYGANSNGEESSIREFYQETEGEIVECKAECVTHTVSISSFERPVFTAAFETALRSLHVAATKSGSEDHDRVFIDFVNEYGTHYMKTTYLGSKLIFEKRFGSKSSSQAQQSQRSECVANSVRVSVGADIGRLFSSETSFSTSAKACEDSSSSYSSKNGNAFQSEKIITIGSLPTTSLEDWAEDVKISPVPISFELEKISTLFRDEWFQAILLNANNTSGEVLNASAMIDYFEDKSSQYCKIVLGEDCEEILTGCGLSSMCPGNTKCINDDSISLGYRCVSTYGGVIIAGGYNGGFLSSTEAISTWLPSNLPATVYALTITHVNGYLFQCGGFRTSGSTRYCYKLDLANSPSWSSTFSLPVAMYYHTAVAIGSNIWFVYGSKLYDLNTVTYKYWTYTLPFRADKYHCAVSNNTHSYIIGAGGQYDEIWVNTDASSPADWQKVATLAVGRTQFGCLWFANEIFVTGGSLNGGFNQVEIFETLTNNVWKTGNLVQGRYLHSMMVLDGKAAVVGGRGKDISGTYNYLDSMETYNATTYIWETESRRLSTERRSFGLAQIIVE